MLFTFSPSTTLSELIAETLSPTVSIFSTVLAISSMIRSIESVMLSEVELNTSNALIILEEDWLVPTDRFLISSATTLKPEVKLITSTDCFNTSGGADLYISQDGTEWTYVTKISGGDSHIILSGDLTEKGITLPAKIMFGALTEFNCDNKGNARAYTITDITNDDKGKFITYTLGSTYDNTTSVIANGTTYKNKFTIASNTKQAISNTVSAPTISSPKAVVNDDTKKATLSAYLAKTGCSAITNYGFQYIMSETEPSESGWTNSTKQDFTNNIVIGKTFKWETTELGEGKYWFRAYAKNEAGKISYTSPISFEIIADGPYPVFIDAVQDHESEAALYITNDGYVEVKIYNKGKDDDDDVLEGSYKLIIENQNQNLLFTPLRISIRTFN